MISFNKSITIDLFKTAFLVRTIEEVIADNYKNGLMRCPTHLSIGQELVPSILSVFQNSNDLAVSTHRSHGHYLGKGGALLPFFDELHGLSTGCSTGNGGSMHLTDTEVGFIGSTAIVGNTIPVGVGLAQSLKLDCSSNFVYIFLGDGATEEGVFFESVQYAVLKELPCLFVIENNEYSVYTPIIERQNISLKQKLQGLGLKYFKNENHDFKDLFNKFNSAIDNLRIGKGPIVIEVFTHRYREHCGPDFDDNLNYRSANFLKEWKDKDIINLLKLQLTKDGLSESEIHNISTDIKTNVKEIFKISEKNAIRKFNEFKMKQ
tara:strand:- start:3136 stop:4095 length:960 start_codon:yes stop_codon:yes gene_type:complete